MGCHSNTKLIVRRQIVPPPLRGARDREERIGRRFRGHDAGRVGGAHIVSAVSGLNRKTELIIQNFLIRIVSQQQFEYQRIFVVETDHFEQIHLEFLELERRLLRETGGIAQLGRVAFRQHIVCFRHIDQRQQPGRSDCTAVARRSAAAAGASGEVHGGERLFVILNQIENVGFPVEHHGQRPGRPLTQCDQVEIVSSGLRRNLKIGAPIGGDVNSRDFGNGRRKRHGRGAVVFLDEHLVNLALGERVLLELVHVQNLLFIHRLFGADSRCSCKYRCRD